MRTNEKVLTLILSHNLIRHIANGITADSFRSMTKEKAFTPKGFTVWVKGLPCSRKSTLAKRLSYARK